VGARSDAALAASAAGAPNDASMARAVATERLL
jgi:hypothetical protein